MAINKKLIHFQTREAFNTQLESNNILDTSIVFIKETKEIWTHGQLYPCPLSLEEITTLLSKKVDKVTGKSLVSDSEIEKLLGLPNNTELNNLITTAKAAGDNAQSDLNAHKQNKSNPHEVTKAQVGLGNVTNDAQVKRSEMGVANGVATLDADGKVPSSQLPSYVDDIVDVYATYSKSDTGVLSNIVLYSDAAKTQLVTGETGKIYQNVIIGEPAYQFRWTGTVFAQTGANSLIIGEVSGTAYDGAKGKANADNIAKINSISDNMMKDIAEIQNTLYLPYKAVDLGLPSGILWADRNIGASSPEDSGLYFQWGDIQGYTADQIGTSEGQKVFTWDDYKFGTDSNLTKYNETDGKTVLDPEDDAATVNMGSKFRMPTQSEMEELFNNTDIKWVIKTRANVGDTWGEETEGNAANMNTDGIVFDDIGNFIEESSTKKFLGVRFYGKGEYASNFIFVPAAGYCQNGIYYHGYDCSLWSSQLDSDLVECAMFSFFYADGDASVGARDGRSQGFSVRGVTTSTKKVSILDTKVDKEEGKGLSSNDFTDDFKTKLEGIEAGAQVNTVTSVAGKTGEVMLNKTDVGLGNVDNTSDANKPISTATQTALNQKVDKSSTLLIKRMTTTEYNNLAVKDDNTLYIVS